MEVLAAIIAIFTAITAPSGDPMDRLANAYSTLALSRTPARTQSRPVPVQVETPKKGATLYEGGTYTTSWSYRPKETFDGYNIRLGNTLVSSFKSSVLNLAELSSQANSAQFTVPKTVVEDLLAEVKSIRKPSEAILRQNFFLEIEAYRKSNGGEAVKVASGKSGSFNIEPVASLQVTYPHAGANILAGSRHTIRWKGTISNSTEYTISLTGGELGSSYITLARVPATESTYLWSVLAGIPPGSAYVIWVRGNQDLGSPSEPFNIVAQKGAKDVVSRTKSACVEDRGKLDIVLVPVGFKDQAEWSRIAAEHIDAGGSYKGVLAFEPFRSSAGKIKFTTIPVGAISSTFEKEFADFKCRYADSYYTTTCAKTVKTHLKSLNCAYDKAMIVYNNAPGEGGGWAESLGGAVGVTLAREYPPFDSQGHTETVHELAHLLGLTDTKVTTGEFNGYGMSLAQIPNADSAGCKKWCGDYVKEPSGSLYKLCKDLPQSGCQQNVNCSWLSKVDSYYNTQCVPLDDHVNIGKSCLPGTGCYHNANGAGAWRPSDYDSQGRPTSMMFYMTNSLGLDAVDQRFLRSAIQKF